MAGDRRSRSPRLREVPGAPARAVDVNLAPQRHPWGAGCFDGVFEGESHPSRGAQPSRGILDVSMEGQNSPAPDKHWSGASFPSRRGIKRTGASTRMDPSRIADPATAVRTTSSDRATHSNPGRVKKSSNPCLRPPLPPRPQRETRSAAGSAGARSGHVTLAGCGCYNRPRSLVEWSDDPDSRSVACDRSPVPVRTAWKPIAGPMKD
jgi:hypothetical protein